MEIGTERTPPQSAPRLQSADRQLRPIYTLPRGSESASGSTLHTPDPARCRVWAVHSICIRITLNRHVGLVAVATRCNARPDTAPSGHWTVRRSFGAGSPDTHTHARTDDLRETKFALFDFSEMVCTSRSLSVLLLSHARLTEKALYGRSQRRTWVQIFGPNSAHPTQYTDGPDPCPSPVTLA